MYRKHLKFTFRGIFAGTPETFSFGLHMGSVVEEGQDAVVGDIDEGAVTDALEALCLTARFPQNAHFTDWRAYNIGDNGLMEGNPLFVDVSTNAQVRGNITTQYPPQVACVVTLVGANRGHARYGRMYWPTGQTISPADSRMTTGEAASIADAATQFLKSVSDAIDFPLNPNGSAGINVSNDATGTWQEIDHVEVGRALDTLRSRRRSLLEERVIDGHIDW